MEQLFKLDAKYNEWLINHTPVSRMCNEDEKHLEQHYLEIFDRNDGDTFIREMKVKLTIELYTEIMLYLHGINDLDEESIIKPIHHYIKYKISKQNWMYKFNTWGKG